MFLIFLQPDLGSTLVLPPIAFTLLYAARIPAKFFLTTAILFVLLLGLLGLDIYRYYQHKSENLRTSEPVVAYEDNALLPLKDYQRKRILTFIAPEVVDPQGIGPNWNRIQALIAVSTGGITGKGWGEGMQAKLGYLPPAVAHNDFIFAVLAEEWGLVGSVFALFAYAIVIFGCLKVASKLSGYVWETYFFQHCRLTDGSSFYKCGNDPWHHTYHWVTSSVYELWWIFYHYMFCNDGSGTERIPI